MPHFTAEDWKAWNDERQKYSEYDSQGFKADIATLTAHIETLKQVAPKDKAGWPDWHALRVLDMLERDLATGKAWLGTMP